MIVPLTLVRGDQLILTPDYIPGGPACTDEQGNVLEPAHIPCTLTEAFDSVKPGDRVWLDDASTQ